MGRSFRLRLAGSDSPLSYKRNAWLHNRTRDVHQDQSGSDNKPTCQYHFHATASSRSVCSRRVNRLAEGWSGPASTASADGSGAGPFLDAGWHTDAVEPVEINAGVWYLRALRADDRVDDRPALAELGEHRTEYVALLAAQWDSEILCSWAVCEPTTGELLAEVTLEPSTGTIGTRARPGHEQAARTGAEAVQRFADAVFGG